MPPPALKLERLDTSFTRSYLYRRAPSRGSAKPPQGLPGASRRRAALGIPSMTTRVPRAVVFIDGANLYHALKTLGVRANAVDPLRVARKLVEFRDLVEMRYYIAAVERTAPLRVHAAYLGLRERLARSPEVVVRTGHIQVLREPNPCARELHAYLASLGVRIPGEVFRDLDQLATRHRQVEVYREKGVDVALACDLVDLARRDGYDVAYLISGDADFVPAVEIVRSIGKRVFVASPDVAARLIRAADATIRLRWDWFEDCLDVG